VIAEVRHWFCSTNQLHCCDISIAPNVYSLSSGTIRDTNQKAVPLIPYGVEVFFFHFDHFTDGRTLGRVISSSQGLYLNIGQHKHRINTHTYQTSMPCVGFEPMIPASERTKTVCALDRSATVTGRATNNFQNSLNTGLYIKNTECCFCKQKFNYSSYSAVCLRLHTSMKSIIFLMALGKQSSEGESHSN
jgi:hypothetical protein